ncbi:MAG: glucose-6-phosphate 1-dehydrogenase [Pseudomonadota bacterium]
MRDAETSTLDIVIFGGAGDLSWRKLLPSLYMAHLHGRLEDGCRIVGVGRNAWTRDDYVAFIDKQSPPHLENGAFDAAVWQSFLARLDFASLNATSAEGYAKLAQTCQAGSTKVFYLATAPSLFTTICEHLNQAGLIDKQSRVVLEKPLGHDLPSAQAINDAVAKHFDERQIYRIDHYLGKETVQNLMVLRFGNAILEPLWRAPYIKSVQITVAETVGVGTRAGFYDHTGAMRDMVQNHLLQLLCIVAMEPPISLDPDDVRDEKLKVLKSLRKMDLNDIKRDTVRGQYTEGVVQGKQVKGYLQEADVPENSQTETFVALRAMVNNARWAGVPFFLRTGKCMQKRHSEIIIEYTEPPFSIFAGQPQGSHPNRLVITLQPEESIRLQMMAKEPGSGMNMQPVYLNLDLQSAFTERRAEAYERLLIDVIKGRLTHFMRRDELEAAWTWADPILQTWKQMNDKPRPYPAGSWGPAASSALVARENAVWAEAQ